MIKVYREQNKIIIKGHADYDDYGKDIVCASVSSIVITTVNAILEIDRDAVIYKEEKDAMNVLKNLHPIEITKNGLKKHIDYKCWIGDKNSSFLNKKMPLYKKAIKNTDINILENTIYVAN